MILYSDVALRQRAGSFSLLEVCLLMVQSFIHQTGELCSSTCTCYVMSSVTESNEWIVLCICCLSSLINEIAAG